MVVKTMRKLLIHRILILSEDIAIAYPPPITGASLIRLGDFAHSFPSLKYEEEYGDIIKLNFDDIGETPYQVGRRMTDRDAMRIINFFVRHKDCQLMVVHCLAGISRSSAVAIAWARFNEDEEAENLIRNCSLYMPNEYILRKLTEYLQRYIRKEGD